MKALPRRDAGAIRIDLTVPVTRIGYGPFSFNPVEHLFGAPLVEILDSLLVGPVQRRPSQTGPDVDVYPLALPDGEGAALSLGAWGELGFANDGGDLVLTVPLAMRAWVAERLNAAILRTDEYLSEADGCRVSRLRLRLTPGERAALPLGSLGELSIEVKA